MQYRCTGGFTYRDRVIAGGQLVDGQDPILTTHGQYFVEVAIPAAPAGETASTDTPRRPGRPKKVPGPQDSNAELVPEVGPQG